MGLGGSFFKSFTKALFNPSTLIAAALMAFNPVFGLGYLASLAVYAGGLAAMSALAPTPKMPDFSSQGYNSFLSEATNRTQMLKQPAQKRRVVFGKTRVSGTMIFAETKDLDFTDNDETQLEEELHLIFTIATHEIISYNNFTIDGEQVTVRLIGSNSFFQKFEVTSDRFLDEDGNSLIQLFTYFGNDDQPVSAVKAHLGSVVDDNFRLRGVAYIYAIIKYNQEAFPQGIPNISAEISGRSPLEMVSGATSRVALSFQNPANMILEYLRDSRYGLGCDDSELDIASFSSAATICGNNINLATGGSEQRYTVNGAFEMDQSPKDIIEKLLTSCAGILSYSNGKFRLKVGTYVSPSVTLTEDDFRGPINLQAVNSRSDRYNSVRGTYSSADENYIVTDYPVVTSSTFKTEDNNEEVFLDYNLPFTTSTATAQRLAKIALFRNRQDISISSKFSMKAFQLDVGDTVQITLPRYGFTDKIFEVSSWSLSVVGGQELVVEMNLRETASSVYDWDAEETTFATDNSTLPDPFTISAPTITTSDSLQLFNQKAISVLEVTCRATSPFTSQFEVFAQGPISTALDTSIVLRSRANRERLLSGFIPLGQASGNKFELLDVQDNGFYRIFARTVTAFGTKSAFATASHTVVGKAANPDNVTDFSVNIVGRNAELRWNAVSDVDLSHYNIRFQPVTTSALFSSATQIAQVGRPQTATIVPAREGTYFCVAEDKFGNVSATPASLVALITEPPGVEEFVQLATFTETSFTGTKSNTIVDSEGGLILETTNNFDSVTGDFDDATGNFDAGSGNIATSGTYDLANVLDNSVISKSLLEFDVTFTRVQNGVTKTDSTGTVDVEIFVDKTDDAPSAGTGFSGTFRRLSNGDVTARGFKFRLKLSSSDAFDTPKVTSVIVRSKVEPRTIAQGDIASGTDSGGKVITFSPAFVNLQGIGINAENLATGDFFTITNKTTTGFTIIFKNSSDSVINRTFDFTAVGAGRIAS